MSHPDSRVCTWYLVTAYSVVTVFGADVPPGRLLTVWIAGLARQWLPSVQGGPPLLPGSAGLPWHVPLHEVALSQSISICGRPASPGRMVRMSVPGAIWLALIPYLASNRGVATKTVPVKLDGLFARVPTWYSVPADSSGTADACRLAARVFTRAVRVASWAPLSGMLCPGFGLWFAGTITWLLDRLGPIQLSGLSNLMLAATQTPMARNTANVVAASAAPDRAR